jgi:hypothetical protein
MSEILICIVDLAIYIVSWVNFHSGTLSDLATVIAVIYAVREWSRWKRQTIAHRAHDVALDAIEELRTYSNLLNAARMCPTNAAITDFDSKNFSEAESFLLRAQVSRTEVIRLCELTNDLGLGEEARKLANRLAHGEARIRRPFQSARSAFDRGKVDKMCEHLNAFFRHPGAETSLDLEILQSQESLREILLKLIRFSE